MAADEAVGASSLKGREVAGAESLGTSVSAAVDGGADEAKRCWYCAAWLYGSTKCWYRAKEGEKQFWARHIGRVHRSFMSKA